MESHMILIMLNFWCSMTLVELPDFKPNEYFWKHHLKEGEEKWECFARCTKEIMAK